MASKKTGRLAGLAALAGAAYLADKKGMFGGKGKDAKADRDDADRYTGSRASKEDEAVEEGESVQSKFRKEELKAGDIAAMAPRKVAPVKTATAAAPAKSSSSGPISGDAFDNERTGGDARMSRMDELHSSYRPRSGDAKLRDVTFNRPSEGKTSSYSNRVLKSIGAEEREQSDADRYGTSSAPKPAPKSGVGSTITNRPDPRAPSIYAGEEAWAKYRALQKEDKGMKRGGAVKKMASGGMTSSASKRGDGIASKGKTRCKMY